jgi:hypothetical protein
MAIIQKAIYRGVPGGTAYTVPPNTSAIVTNVVVANSSATAKNVTINIVSNLVTTPIVSNSPVNGNDTIVLDIRQVIAAGDQITVAGDAGIHVHISGVEVQS